MHAGELLAACLPAADAPYPRCFAGPLVCRSPAFPSRRAAGLQASMPARLCRVWLAVKLKLHKKRNVRMKY